MDVKFKNVHCTSRRPRRNDERVNDPSLPAFSIFNYPGRFHCQPRARLLNQEELHVAHKYVLRNCPEVQPYYAMFVNYLRKQGHTAEEIDLGVDTHFHEWFKRFVQKETNGVTDPTLCSIVWGPSEKAKCWPAYFVNGYNFYTVAHGEWKTTMNSDICCSWFDPTNGTQIHRDYKLVDVNRKKKFWRYDPFILAQQAIQVYYSDYPSVKKDKVDWMAVCETKSRRVVQSNTFDDKEDDEMAYQIDEILDAPSVPISDHIPSLFEHLEGMDLEVDLGELPQNIPSDLQNVWNSETTCFSWRISTGQSNSTSAAGRKRKSPTFPFMPPDDVEEVDHDMSRPPQQRVANINSENTRPQLHIPLPMQCRSSQQRPPPPPPAAPDAEDFLREEEGEDENLEDVNPAVFNEFGIGGPPMEDLPPLPLNENPVEHVTSDEAKKEFVVQKVMIDQVQAMYLGAWPHWTSVPKDVRLKMFESWRVYYTYPLEQHKKMFRLFCSVASNMVKKAFYHSKGEEGHPRIVLDRLPYPNELFEVTHGTKKGTYPEGRAQDTILAGLLFIFVSTKLLVVLDCMLAFCVLQAGSRGRVYGLGVLAQLGPRATVSPQFSITQELKNTVQQLQQQLADRDAQIAKRDAEQVEANRINDLLRESLIASLTEASINLDLSALSSMRQTSGPSPQDQVQEPVNSLDQNV
ncbi:hypothetical protein COLO4_35592 [Corchorus olitorius]|uniref:DUF4216 domain-containing protein n=1 Tax=Corchorus olitorius TaxID=93759 RepID=A0A1R3GF18_9ROSI|nr:hypothetical protein COLO4_35592 [Corchorus olitorius]